MTGTIMDLVPNREGEDPVKADLEIMRQMVQAQKAMAGEYVCNCGIHGDEQARIEACTTRPCYFHQDDGTLDAPYQAFPELDKMTARIDQALADLAEGKYPRCRACGCHDLHACNQPCWWVEPDLCSSCAPKGGTQ